MESKKSRIENSPYLTDEQIKKYDNDRAEYLENEITKKDEAVDKTMDKIDCTINFKLL